MAYKRKPLARRPAKRRIIRKRVARKTNMVKSVKKALAQMSEKKMLRYSGGGPLATYNGLSIANNIFPIMPIAGTTTGIQQGDGQSDRTGNRITTRSMYFTGILTPSSYDATYNPNPKPRDVLMYIFSSKQDPTSILAGVGQFYQSNNTSINPSATLIDSILSVNTDRYTLYHKRIFKVGTAEFAGTGINANAQRFANNDYKYNCKFKINCTKWMPKNLKYNDTSNIPNNRFLYCIFMPVNADGSAELAGTAQQLVNLTYNWEYKYLDI